MNIWEPQTNETLDIPFWSSDYIETTERRKEELSKLLNTKEITPTGSRHIEIPSKKGTDDDYLVYIPNLINLNATRELLVKDGWIDCLTAWEDVTGERYKEELYPMEYWGAFRKGETNIVVYTERNMYENSVHATVLCTKLNVRDKEKRIRIFRWYKFQEPLKKGDLDESVTDTSFPL